MVCIQVSCDYAPWGQGEGGEGTGDRIGVGFWVVFIVDVEEKERGD
jgi:hypothetical protein